MSIHRQLTIWFYHNSAAGSFHTKNFVADCIRWNLNFNHENDKFAFQPLFLEVTRNPRIHLQLIGKCVVGFLFAIIELFRQLLRFRRYNQILVKVGVFKGWVILSANFRWKRTSSTNLCWYQKTRVITLFYGVKILAVYFFRFFTKHPRGGQTDGRTVKLNYDPQDLRQHGCFARLKRHIRVFHLVMRFLFNSLQ